jgi:hypothetical protein
MTTSRVRSSGVVDGPEALLRVTNETGPGVNLRETPLSFGGRHRTRPRPFAERDARRLPERSAVRG